MIKWQDSLKKINKFIIEELERSIPESSNNIDEVVAFSEHEFQLYIPQEFTAFWKIQNGFEFDGNIFYHTDTNLTVDVNPMDIETNNAIIASNIIWHDSGDVEFLKYTFLGDGDIDWYVYDTEAKNYKILDKPSGELMETYDTFDEFFSTCLGGMAERI